MICVSIANISFEELMSQIQAFKMLELRLDLLEFSCEQYQTIFNLDKTIVATYRYGKTNDEKRISTLKKAIKLGASYVDIEIDADHVFVSETNNFAKKNSCKTILSFHDFNKTPSLSFMENIILQANKMDADYVKIATMANNKQDISRILSLYEHHDNLIAFNIGKIGRISRVSGIFLGADFSYASLSSHNSTASGQYTYREMKELIKKLT